MSRKNQRGSGSIPTIRGGLKMVANNSPTGHGESAHKFRVNDIVFRVPISWPRVPLMVVAQLPDGELFLNDMASAKPENIELLDED
jgi:hypothetical protein